MTTLTTCDLSTQPDLNPTDFQVYVLELVRNAKVPNLAMLVTDQSAGSTIINALTNQAKQSHIDWYQLSSRLCRTYRLPVGTMITTDVLFVEGLEQYLMQYPLFTLDLLFRRAKQMMATIVTIDEQSFATGKFRWPFFRQSYSAKRTGAPDAQPLWHSCSAGLGSGKAPG
jgi:hypothetical protein